MHSISDLTTTCTRTAGHVPPRLVGASTTVVGSKMYLFGGRLVAERTMVSDLHIFDLKTSTWEPPLTPALEGEQPPARYFHSADAWGDTIVIFGGMGNNPDSPDPEDLIVLNDLWTFDIPTGRWRSGSPPTADPSAGPRARYAHLSAVTAHTLYIIGGQDINNVWLDDVCAYDLRSRAWVSRRPYPRHCGTYRSVAVASPLAVVTPKPNAATDAQFDLDGVRQTPLDSLIHLPYSTIPPDDSPSDIYLYSNYNFTDVRRELEVFTPIPGTDAEFSITDRSGSMSGTSLPPGLRFPAGAVLGTHLVLTGTYLAQSFQTYSVWALDLTTNVWHRIEPGTPLTSGSWFRSCLWAEDNKLVVFGDRHGSLVEDYNRRLLCWDYACTIDLEAFGVYQPPREELSMPAQVTGLSALETALLADFELLSEDGHKVRVSRRLLEERWPWFREQRRRFEQQARREAAALLPASASASNVSLPGTAAPSLPAPDVVGPGGSGYSNGVGAAGVEEVEERADPRLSPRAFYLTEPYPIVLALAQYFYAQALITPLQHAPAVLSQLLVLSSLYGLEHLQRLTAHAMHRVLSKSTSVGIYEVATLSSCRSLQIRALKMVMAYNTRRPNARTRRPRDRDNDTDQNGRVDGHGEGGGGSTSNGRRVDDQSTAARPRGMSDASFMTPSTGGRSGYTGNSFQTNAVESRPRWDGGRLGVAETTVYAPSPIEGPSEIRQLFSVDIDLAAVQVGGGRDSPDAATIRAARDHTQIRNEDPPVAGQGRSRAPTVSRQEVYHLPRPRPTPLDTSEDVTQAQLAPVSPEFGAYSPGGAAAVASASRSPPPPQLSTSPASSTSSALPTPTTGNRAGFASSASSPTIKPPPRTTSRNGLRNYASLSALTEAAGLGPTIEASEAVEGGALPRGGGDGAATAAPDAAHRTIGGKPRATPTQTMRDLDAAMAPALSPFGSLAMAGGGRF